MEEFLKLMERTLSTGFVWSLVEPGIWEILNRDASMQEEKLVALRALGKKAAATLRQSLEEGAAARGAKRSSMRYAVFLCQEDGRACLYVCARAAVRPLLEKAIVNLVMES